MEAPVPVQGTGNGFVPLPQRAADFEAAANGIEYSINIPPRFHAMIAAHAAVASCVSSRLHCHERAAHD